MNPTRASSSNSDDARNAVGAISERQRQALIERYDCSTVVMGLWLVAVFVSLAAVIHFLPTLGVPIAEDDRPSFALVAALVGAFLSALALALMAIELLKRVYTLPRVERVMQRPVRQGDGSIEWHRGRMVGVVDQRQYPSVYGSDGEHQQLEAGRYTIHFIDNPNWMLSARRLKVATEAEHADVLSRSLGRANGLLVESLAFNRQGRMSAGQRRRLLVTVMRRTLHLLASLLPVALLLGFVVVATSVVVLPALAEGALTLPAFPSLADVQHDYTVLVPWVIAGGVLVLVIGAVVYVIREALDILWTLGMIAAGRVLQVTSELVLHHYQDNSSDDGPVDHYYYIVGGYHFVTNVQAFEISPEGAICTAYFLPLRNHRATLKNARHLLNIEVNERPS